MQPRGRKDESGKLHKGLGWTMAVPQPRIERVEQLRGIHKVTALLLAMGKPLADRIIRQLDDRDIRALARSASELPPVEMAAIDQIVTELAHQLESACAVEGSSSGARALLSGIVPDEEVGEIMGEIAGQPPTLIWRKLADVAEDKLASFISTEQPQVAAYVLSRLDPDKASAVMEKLDGGLRVDLGMRIVSLKPIGDAAARILAERLGGELLGGGDGPAGGPNNHALLGSIINKLDREKSAPILDRLGAERPDDARKVARYVFKFEDVTGLSSEDRARLFEEASAERVVMALRECDPELSAVILAALSPRARRLIDSELANPIKASRKSIDEARRAIAGLALALAERSVITLPAAMAEAVEAQGSEK